MARLVARPQETKLREPAVRIENQAVTHNRCQFVRRGEPFLQRAATVLEWRVHQAPVACEELKILVRTYKYDFCFWKTPLRRIHEGAGDRDVGAQRDAAQHEYATRIAGD